MAQVDAPAPAPAPAPTSGKSFSTKDKAIADTVIVAAALSAPAILYCIWKKNIKPCFNSKTEGTEGDIEMQEQ